MNPIEAAAREIASHCEHKSEADIAKIITRHLFPVVRPEDCHKDRLYCFRCDANEWFIDNGDWAKRLCDVREIRGPVPFPE